MRMALTRSQWLAVIGGGILVATPLVVATGGGMLVGIWGPSADGGALWRDPGLDLLTLVRLVGMLALPFGIAVILSSVWFATARLFVLPSLLGIVATVIAGAQMYDFGGYVISKEWLLLGIGNLLVLISALLDRAAYRAFVGRSSE
jgi:hypothetical protein